MNIFGALKSHTMLHTKYLGVFILLFLFSPSCKEQTASKDEATDTRLLVKDAYAQIDHLKLSIAFAWEIASMWQEKITQTTDVGEQLNLGMLYGTELLKLGKTDEAISVLEQTLDYINKNDVEIDPGSKRLLISMIGILSSAAVFSALPKCEA